MMNNWGGGYDGGTSAVGGILMMVFWVAIIVGVVLLVVWLVRSVAGGTYAGGRDAWHAGHGPGYGPGQGESALDILDKRYARGEIDKAEYEQRRKDLTA